MFPLTRVPFWYRFFEPQPSGPDSQSPVRSLKHMNPRGSAEQAQVGVLLRSAAAALEGHPSSPGCLPR